MTRGVYAITAVIFIWHMTFLSIHNILTPAFMRSKKKNWPSLEKWVEMPSELKY